MANFTNHPPTRKRRKPSSVNTSGIPGVSFKSRDYGWSTSVYIQVAYTDEKGVLRNYQRSVRVHGIEGALKYALAMRRKMGASQVPSLAQALEHFRTWEREERSRSMRPGV